MIFYCHLAFKNLPMVRTFNCYTTTEKKRVKQLEFIISASTDIGIKKQTNQDSLTVKRIDTPAGKMVLAVLCDGMGGLSNGEVASASLIRAFEKWLYEDFVLAFENSFDINSVTQAWNEIVVEMNKKIQQYGQEHNISLGTTVTAMLITENQYCILNVGDSRVYEISDNLYQITNDQTLVAKEVSEGKLTPQEAETDPRRSVLLQCCGASTEVVPEFHYGQTKKDTVFLLCSDGFRHQISPEEIYLMFDPSCLIDETTMKNSIDYLIELNKQRLENDNISAILIRSF